MIVTIALKVYDDCNCVLCVYLLGWQILCGCGQSHEAEQVRRHLGRQESRESVRGVQEGVQVRNSAQVHEEMPLPCVWSSGVSRLLRQHGLP